MILFYLTSLNLYFYYLLFTIIMDRWDEYCPLCGLVLGGFTYHDINNINENYVKKHIELFNLYKNNFTKFSEIIEKINSDSHWTNDIVFLNINNNNYYDCNCNNECDVFYNEDETIKYKHCNLSNDENDILGFGIHRKCIEYIKNKYFFELKYNDLNMKDIKYNSEIGEKKIFKDVDYGNIEKCWDQWFNVYALLNYHYNDIDEIINGPKEDNILGNMIDKVLLSRCFDKM